MGQWENGKRMSDIYKHIQLKDGRKGTIVDHMGSDYVVDIGTKPEDWETILVKQEEIEDTN